MYLLQTPSILPVTPGPWNAQQWGNAAQWASAILTFVAICFALLKEWILGRFWHPRLTVRMRAVHPDCVKTPLKHGDDWSGSKYFLRAWIGNIGRVRAEDVEVFLAKAWVEEKVDDWAELPRFTPQNLRWSYSDWKKPTIHVDGISRRMGRYCDLAAITQPGHPDLRTVSEPEKTRLGLQLEFLGPASEYLPTGKYRFEILVAASNRKPVAYFIEIHLTGLWSDNETEMLKHGFTVSVGKA